MSRKRFDAMPCSIARALDLVGDWWTLLIIREAFLGVRRFADFRDHLGIARNILSDRLQKLVDEGILSKQPKADAERGFEYRLTEKGRDLWAGADGAAAVGRQVDLRARQGAADRARSRPRRHGRRSSCPPTPTAIRSIPRRLVAIARSRHAAGSRRALPRVGFGGDRQESSVTKKMDHRGRDGVGPHDEGVAARHREKVAHARELRALDGDRARRDHPGKIHRENGLRLRVPAITPTSKSGAGRRRGKLVTAVPSSVAVGPRIQRNRREPPSQSTYSLPPFGDASITTRPRLAG